jgi:thiamine biosynthesis lipoprotein
MRGFSELCRLEKTADAMGTTYSVVLYGTDLTRMDEAIDATFDEVGRLEEMLSNYRPDSEWSEVNTHAAKRPVKVSPELFRLLSACQRYSRESEGAFDVTVAPLTRAWGFFKGRGCKAGRADVVLALRAVGYRYLRLDPMKRTVKFGRRGMEICPGGVGKGYTVDRMVGILKRRGFDTALIAASRSSIYGLGAPPAEPRGWRVDICDPANPKKQLDGAYLKNMSMSTSGTFEKYFCADGCAYSHIIDPRSGYPAQGTSLVSVMAPHTLDSEAWTKACLIHGLEWTRNHVPRGFRVFLCREKTGNPGVWLS